MCQAGWKGGRGFHDAAQNSEQLKTEELFISAIFSLMFLDQG